MCHVCVAEAYAFVFSFRLCDQSDNNQGDNFRCRDINTPLSGFDIEAFSPSGATVFFDNGRFWATGGDPDRLIIKFHQGSRSLQKLTIDTTCTEVGVHEGAVFGSLTVADVRCETDPSPSITPSLSPSPSVSATVPNADVDICGVCNVNSLTFTYDHAPCSASDNSMGTDFSCVDFNTPADGNGNLLFVSLSGDELTHVSATRQLTVTDFDDRTIIKVKEGSTHIQALSINTLCQSTLALQDRFGTLILTGFGCKEETSSTGTGNSGTSSSSSESSTGNSESSTGSSESSTGNSENSSTGNSSTGNSSSEDSDSDSDSGTSQEGM